jgi:hypothetical protein
VNRRLVVEVPGLVMEYLPGMLMSELMFFAGWRSEAHAKRKNEAWDDVSPAPHSADEQARRFRARAAQAMRRATGKSRGARRQFADALSSSTWDVMIGLARGHRHLYAHRVAHRDLGFPGKHALIKRDGEGLTAALVDFSSAELCGTGDMRSAWGLAVDSYAFGNVLAYVCYGRMINCLSNQFVTYPTCSAASPQVRAAREMLRSKHARIHPGGRAVPAPGLINRCARPVQRPLDELMTHLWEPAVGVTPAAKPSASGGNSTGHWDHVIAKLEALRRVSTSMFDPQLLGRAVSVASRPTSETTA